MSKLRLAGFSGAMVLSALIGGTLISAVAAAPAATPAVTPAAPAAPAAAIPVGEPSEHCTAFRAAFAANLGKTEAEVVAAAKAAIGSTVDAAVADGSLTPDAAARLKTRVAGADADGCKILSGWRAKARGAVGIAKDSFAAVAEALDMTTVQLRAELKSGKNLKDVAAAQGVPYTTLTAAALASIDEDLDAAVAAGNLEQARADRILERLERRLEAGWPRRGAGTDGP